MTTAYIDPASKLLGHMDRLAELQATGRTSAPVNIEVDLSNRCSLGCEWCVASDATIQTSRGARWISDVKPGDLVQAGAETGDGVEWALVHAVSRRYSSEPRYRIRVGSDSIEATGNHQVYTRRGWVRSDTISCEDEIAMRVWVRPASVDAGVDVAAGSLEHAGESCGCECADARVESDERSCDCGTCGCEPARDEPEDLRDAEAVVCGGQVAADSSGRGGVATYVGADARREPDARPGSRRAGEGYAVGERLRAGGAGTHDGTLAAAWVPRSTGGAYALAEPDEGRGRGGTQPREDKGATLTIEARSVDDRRVPAGSVAGVVHWDGRVLGTQAQPGLQGSREATGDRVDGRLLSNADETHDRELRGADDQALRVAWLQMPGGDGAGAKAASHTSVRGGVGAGDPIVRADGSQLDVEFRRVTSVTRVTGARMVYNLETSAATYFASGLLVHNCHFAYTHTRGPLAGKVAKPLNATPGGDLMDYELATRMLDQFDEAGVRSVTWTGGGEPTLHPQFDEITSWARVRKLGQGLYTHGGHVAQKPERARALKRDFTFVYVSLDAADAADYKRDKGVDRFEAACTGVRALVDADGPCTIGVGFLLTETNWERYEEMIALSKTLGADYCQFRPTILYSQDDPTMPSEDTGWMAEALPHLQSVVQEAGVEVDVERFRMYETWTGHSYHTCNWAAMQTVVTPNGKLWTCVNKREHPAEEIGDLSVESFAEVWARHTPPAVNEHCRVMCRGHLANLSLDTLLKHRPHAEFI